MSISISRPTRHFQRPDEEPFPASERGVVKVLFGGGLSQRAEQLLKAGLEGLGYQAERLRVPTKADFQTGREYGNHGQCNPTYFLVGTLVNHLVRLRDEEGVPSEKILSDYVFLTAGSCGPCRFGMYEAEYRLALRNAGFEGFRVVVFDQDKGLRDVDAELALQLDVDHFLVLLTSVLMSDLLNEVAYHVRPYEIESGRTDEVFEQCLRLCQEALRHPPKVEAGPVARLLSLAAPVDGSDSVAKLLDQLTTRRFTDVLARCRRMIDEQVEVDYTRPKPIVKVTGEFWAQTTEGDGNFHMFSFLEGEGAEVLIEPAATWGNYLLNAARNHVADRKGLEKDGALPARRQLGRRLRLAGKYHFSAAKLTLAEKLLVREYERLRLALGGTAHPLANQLEMQRMAHPFYNSRASGGEGHLEVAKNIYYTHLDLCHMVLSLKPFGCMPSTQSDGAQAAVVSRYPSMIFLPVETSGEGDVNAHSRVQMALGEAKAKNKAELETCLAGLACSLEEIRAYVAEHRELRRPLTAVPRHSGVVGRAANFILHVASLIESDATWKARRQLEAVAA